MAVPDQVVVRSAREPKFTSPDGNAIDLMIEVDHVTGEIPFSARADDPHAHGRELFRRARAGEFGPVKPYVAPKTPDPNELAQ